MVAVKKELKAYHAFVAPELLQQLESALDLSRYYQIKVIQDADKVAHWLVAKNEKCSDSYGTKYKSQEFIKVAFGEVTLGEHVLVSDLELGIDHEESVDCDFDISKPFALLWVSRNWNRKDCYANDNYPDEGVLLPYSKIIVYVPVNQQSCMYSYKAKLDRRDDLMGRVAESLEVANVSVPMELLEALSKSLLTDVVCWQIKVIQDAKEAAKQLVLTNHHVLDYCSHDETHNRTYGEVVFGDIEFGEDYIYTIYDDERWIEESKFDDSQPFAILLSTRQYGTYRSWSYCDEDFDRIVIYVPKIA